MAIFGRLREERRDERELGNGLWRQAYGRFRRAVDRYHQVLEGIPEPDLSEEQIDLANTVSACLPRVRAICRAAHAAAPTENMRVPVGAWSLIHRELTRAGNSLATAAEALALLRLGQAEIDSVRRRVHQVVDQVTTAENALPSTQP